MLITFFSLLISTVLAAQMVTPPAIPVGITRSADHSGGQPVGTPIDNTRPPPGADAPLDEKIDVDTADGLLRAIELTNRTVPVIKSGVRYTRVFGLAGDTQDRFGTFVLENGISAGRLNRRFMIEFNRRVVDGESRDEIQRYMFDGRFLAEVVPSEKQFTIRELAREGEEFDPLSPQQGLFVVPSGQRAADVLDRFQAALRPVEDGLGPFPEAFKQQAATLDARQLLLIPRPGTDAADEFEQIRIWYDVRDRTRVTPLFVRTQDKDGDETRVMFIGREFDPQLEPGFFEIPPPPPREAGWNVEIQRLAPLRPLTDDPRPLPTEEPPR